ncbi:unnamed protein product [Allacma fusca]|uniref:C2H2-type domain-containing protein n=1 Tax=Allacma fusca TaxID=39272 RepID=A0A8J2KS72_9HEXA|nr:unnamed protein product [Allacma fusca]
MKQCTCKGSNHGRSEYFSINQINRKWVKYEENCNAILQQRTLERARAFVCTICAKVLSTNWNLKVHMKTHNVVRESYPCSECQMKFSSPSNLIRHRNECCTGSFNSALAQSFR